MLTSFPKAYAYLQFNDDPYIQAIIQAYNEYQQAYLDAFNGLNLPVYTKLSGALLEWVLTQLYGIAKPVFGTIIGTAIAGGDFNAFRFNEQDYNGQTLINIYAFAEATDDAYQRVATWNLYKGDGFQFNARWLKRRVLRFLTGANGTDPGIDQTYLISVTYSAGGLIAIGCDSSLSNVPLLQQALLGGFLNVPFQYKFSVSTT